MEYLSVVLMRCGSDCWPTRFRSSAVCVWRLRLFCMSCNICDFFKLSIPHRYLFSWLLFHVIVIPGEGCQPGHQARGRVQTVLQQVVECCEVFIWQTSLFISLPVCHWMLCVYPSVYLSIYLSISFSTTIYVTINLDWYYSVTYISICLSHLLINCSVYTPTSVTLMLILYDL